MQSPILEQSHPATKLLFVGLLIIASSIVVMIIATLLGFVFFSTKDILGAYSGNLDNIAVLKYLQITQSISLFIVPALLSVFFMSKNMGKYLSFNRSNISPITLLLVASIMLSAIPFIDYTGYLNQKMILPEFMKGIEDWIYRMEETGKILIEKFAKVHTAYGLILNIIMIGVLPAFGEEMLFRGTIQPLMYKWFKNAHIAVWVTAFIFSTMHFQFYGFLPRLLLGVIMGYMLVWSGSLWLPILAHFVNNTTGVILYFLYFNDVIKVDPNQLGATNHLIPLLLSTALMVLLINLLRIKMSNKSQSNQTLVE